MVPEEYIQSSSDSRNYTSSLLTTNDNSYWDNDEVVNDLQIRPQKRNNGSYSTPVRHVSSIDSEKRMQFLNDMVKTRERLELFKQEMNGLANQINDISEDLHESKNRVYEIEQDITETQEDNVNLQVLLEKAVKHQKKSDTFAAQIIKSIHSDISNVTHENNQLYERLASIEYLQRTCKGNVHDMVAKMREYIEMLEQAQDTIQLMQDPIKHHSTPALHDIETMSISLHDLGLTSRRTSDTSSSYITEEEDNGISIRKESQVTTSTLSSSPSIKSHPRIVHKRSSYPAIFATSPILTPQKDHSKVTQPRYRTQPEQDQGLLLLLK
ncbi:unnamed protein product [Cunninghamella blakesleeana]